MIGFEPSNIDTINKRTMLLTHPNKVYLDGGKVIFTQTPMLIWTVLGSCVAIVFYHPRTKTGAICHAQMPDKHGENSKCSEHCPRPCINAKLATDDFRYVSCSFRYMLKEFAKANINLSELRVHLYGGAEMFKFTKLGVGSKNIEVAKRMLRNNKLTIHSQDIGGNAGRTIYFNTETGQIHVHLQNNELHKI